MTRYDYFETWLTPMEWVTWKSHTYLSPSQRKEYLNEDIDFDNMTESQVDDGFMDMINGYIRWSDTPQGHEYWREICFERRAPIRTL